MSGLLGFLGRHLVKCVFETQEYFENPTVLVCARRLDEALKEPHPLLIPLSHFTPCHGQAHTPTHAVLSLPHAAEHSQCSKTGKIQLLRIINECQLELLSRNLRKFN